MHFDENPFQSQCKNENKKGFKFCTFIGHFEVAVKGLIIINSFWRMLYMKMGEGGGGYSEHYAILAWKLDITTQNDNNNNKITYCTFALNTCTTNITTDMYRWIFQTYYNNNNNNYF